MNQRSYLAMFAAILFSILDYLHIATTIAEDIVPLPEFAVLASKAAFGFLKWAFVLYLTWLLARAVVYIGAAVERMLNAGVTRLRKLLACKLRSAASYLSEDKD